MNKNKKLTLRTETLRRLADTEAARAAGGRPPPPTLTFGMDCDTANCMTLGEFCPTHDCRLTFTSCGPSCRGC